MGLKFFAKDIVAASKSKSILTNIKWTLFNHSIHLVFLIRLGQDFYKTPALGKFLGFIIEYLIRVIYSSDISCRASIGPGLVISHGHDIVIGADVIIGKQCVIFNGVTLGNKDLTISSKGAQPSVGDRVILCTGAKVLGPISLGCNTVVGANAVVLKSFPENSILGGVPAKVIKKSSKTSVLPL